MRIIPLLFGIFLFLFWTGDSYSDALTPLGLPPVLIPEGNPQSPEKIALGKKLFEDKRFSADGTVSCATCHDPAKAFADQLPVAEGIHKLKGYAQFSHRDQCGLLSGPVLGWQTPQS